VKALGGQATERAQITALVLAEQTVRVILDDGYAMPPGRVQNGVHLASNAGVVNYDNCFSTRCDEVCKFGLIKIKSVRSDVDEDGPGASQHESIDGRDKRE
jgi:hypothetical protein